MMMNQHDAAIAEYTLTKEIEELSAESQLRYWAMTDRIQEIMPLMPDEHKSRLRATYRNRLSLLRMIDAASKEGQEKAR